MKQKTIFLGVFISCLYLIIFVFTFHLLQKSSVYNRFFSSFMLTYENVNGSIAQVEKPFTAISEKTLCVFDASHYSAIKDNFYNYSPKNEESKFNSAFFPLFPLLWRMSFLSAKGIMVLNFILHFISALILAFVFCRNSMTSALLIIFSLPTLTVFLIPYSEALFMFSLSIALLGWKQKNDYIYIAGLLAASMTRPVFLLLIFAIVATELFYIISCRKHEINYRHISISVITLLSGTFLVTIFQNHFHHDSLLTFFYAQKHWGTFPQLPKYIIDGSFESLGMDVWALLFSLFFGLIILIPKLLRKWESIIDQFDYWYYFSWIYLLIATSFVLFLQAGSLHSLYRYTLCTPFFYIIIFQNLNTQLKLTKIKAIGIFTVFIFCCVLFIKQAPYPENWNLDEAKGFDFTKAGFILLSLNLFYFLVVGQISNFAKYICLGLLIFSSIIWNCYLLNMVTSNSWLFL
jgi:hypothetical protein